MTIVGPSYTLTTRMDATPKIILRITAAAAKMITPAARILMP